MSGLKKAFLLPHPPIMVPEVGKEETRTVKETLNSVRHISRKVAGLDPELLVIITPHGPSFGDCIGIAGESSLTGTLGAFGVPQVSMTVEINLEVVQQLYDTVSSSVPTAIVTSELLSRFKRGLELDHGLLVPLYFLREAGVNCPAVVIYVGGLSLHDHYRFGYKLQEVISQLGINATLIASGDLSHRLTPSAPAGFHPDGKRFDRFLLESLEKGNSVDIVDIDQGFVRRAGECALKPIATMLGAFDKLETQVKTLSYEGPFGVGYGVVALESCGERDSLMKSVQHRSQSKINSIRQGESWPVKLARQTVETFCRTRQVQQPKSAPPEFDNRAGVFVSIKKDGQLRGCIGTIEPTRESIAAEIVQNAISAAFDDPRFTPIQQHELSSLIFSVDVLKPAERISGKDMLDPLRYGVIVRKGSRSGLLLPRIDGIVTVEEQIAVAAHKAGIRDTSDVELYRFEVVRYE